MLNRMHVLELNTKPALQGSNMLCFLCRKIQIKSTRSTWTLQHHLSFEDLTEAAGGDDGCELCELFKTTLLFYYAEKYFDADLKAAETFHRELDHENSGEVEANHQVFFVVSTLADIDDRFGPCPEGASGLLFLRCALRYEDELFFATDVCPFVQVSVKSGMILPLRISWPYIIKLI
jgi:hypothetical protein